MPPPLDVLAARLSRAREAVPADADALVVTSAANVHYLSGVRMSAGAVVLTRAGAVVVVDGRYADAARAHVEALPETRLATLAPGESYEEALAGQVKAGGWGAVAFEAAHLSVGRLEALRRAVGEAPVRWVPSDGAIEALRAVKDAWEVGILREAGGRLSAVAACILRKVSAGQTERQVAWEIDVALHSAGFDRPAFETIVAAGPNGARPHHHPGPRTLEAGELVLLDFGGVLDGYAVDMSRTVPLGAIDDERQGWLDAVAAAQAAAVAAVQPGRLPSAVDAEARAALAERGLAEHFTHSTGHGLGLDVHERPILGPRGDANGPLAAGMVCTVEPGVYVPGRGGVRIEDDVLVTPDGAERLTS